ncbi:uncharacterized protein [Dermacentor albipictus]|uniref:uncharacterized protein isoform X2 n=1 Tax=Dermacentor albipictus TaxID=60249 RepID=UPI0038FCDDCA
MEERKKKNDTEAAASRAGTRQRRTSLALSNTQLIVADALGTIAERNGIVLLPVMGMGVPGGIEIHRLLRGCLLTISEETPRRKKPSSIAVAAIPDGAKDDVSYAFRNSTIEDALPDNWDLVLKPWSKVDERTCGSHTGQSRRLFPRAEWYPLVDMGVKDSVVKTTQLPRTVQRAWHQTVVASRFTVRLLICRARDATTRGAAAAMTGRFVECDHVPSAECRPDVSGGRRRIHPRGTPPMLNASKAESNGDADGVAAPSSCLWRLQTRFAPNSVDGSTAAPTGVARRLPSARLHLVAAAAAQEPQPLQAALPSPKLRLSKLSR